MTSVETIAQPAAAEAKSVKPVSGKATYTWELKLVERYGKCRLEWSTNAPIRARQGRVALYKDSFPSDPDDRRLASSWDDQNNGVLQTDHGWGAGYCAAYFAENNAGTRTYMIKTPVTVRSSS